MIVTGENLKPQCHFRHHKFQLDWPDIKPGVLWLEAGGHNVAIEV